MKSGQLVRLASITDVSTDLSEAKRRIIERLKRAESSTAPALAAEFDLTDTAIRQHLEALESVGLVERLNAPSSRRGRPPVHWRLAPAASTLFADRHGDLSVELITSIRNALGEAALEQVVRERADRQLATYKSAMKGATSLADRVQRIAELRTTEGYLAEAVESNGEITLVEHHCPIRDAADSCAGLCRAELELFQRALGADVVVAREQHLLDGGQRCAYRVTKR